MIYLDLVGQKYEMEMSHLYVCKHSPRPWKGPVMGGMPSSRTDRTACKWGGGAQLSSSLL